MFRRIVTAGLAALLLSTLGTVPAQAATVKPLRLADYAITISAPPATPGSVCNTGQQLDCGSVNVEATFSGLKGRARPAGGGPQGDLTGSVQVTRVYGCQSGEGRVLTRYTRRVEETVALGTRMDTGYSIPVQGDTLTSTTFAFLPDSQPGNCPAGSRATTYSIRANHVRLVLDSYSASIPDAKYAAPGSARWFGAAPAPVRIAPIVPA